MEFRRAPEKFSEGRFGGGRSRWRSLLYLLLFLAAAGVLVAVVLLLRQELFTGNPRLVLREVRIRSTGYWRDRGKQLCGRIDLEPGANLYSLDLKKLRRKLERIPSIASATVVRVPPDTVEIRIEERIPRAVLGNPRSPFVVDEHCIAIPRLESMAEKLQLPVLTGVPFKLQPGTAVPRIRNAVDLIMTTLRGFPDIRILQISIRRAGSLELRLTYREGLLGKTLYRVIMPDRDTGIAFRLSALQSAIIAARRRGDPRTTFDLSYEGQVVVR